MFSIEQTSQSIVPAQTVMREELWPEYLVNGLNVLDMSSSLIYEMVLIIWHPNL